MTLGSGGIQRFWTEYQASGKKLESTGDVMLLVGQCQSLLAALSWGIQRIMEGCVFLPPKLGEAQQSCRGCGPTVSLLCIRHVWLCCRGRGSGESHTVPHAIQGSSRSGLRVFTHVPCLLSLSPEQRKDLRPSLSDVGMEGSGQERRAHCYF